MTLKANRPIRAALSDPHEPPPRQSHPAESHGHVSPTKCGHLDVTDVNTASRMSL